MNREESKPTEREIIPLTYAAKWLLRRIPRGYWVSTFEILKAAGLTEYQPAINTLRDLEAHGLIKRDSYSRWYVLEQADVTGN